MTLTELFQSALEGRYAVQRRIGAGGMATVFLARDLKHERPVALKVLNPDLGAVLGVERFLSEIRVTANLQHPHLLPLFDSGEAGGLLYYVMPYIAGESLRGRIDREKQLPIADALRVARGVASALDHAHRHGVIHRDLKPENILLHEGEPLVADFGIALAISRAGGNRITQTGISLGTPQYMSPEQATGDRTVDSRSDVYSLAAVLYEMLSGEPPHTGSTSQTIMARVLTERPRSLRAIRSTVPPHIETAIERGLEKLPADRFANAAEFADALSSSPAVASLGTSPVYRPDARPRRMRAYATVGILAMAAFGIGYGARAGFARRGSPFPVEWQGERLSGPAAALAPRVSPDGQFLAFEAMENGQTQVGVLATASGDYTIRTHAQRGNVNDIAWSPDGRIYFTRRYGGRRSSFSVLPVEGNERLVLERAGPVQVLPDNTLLFGRINAAGVEQLYRAEPGRDPTPLDAIQASFGPFGFDFRPSRDGKEVVFFGRPLSDTTAGDHLYALDLASGKIRRLAPNRRITSVKRFPLALSADDRWVLFNLPAGDLHRVVAVPRDGGDDLRVLISLTAAPEGLDVDRNGVIYVDQPAQPVELFQYWPATDRFERTLVPPFRRFFPLPDGRFLVSARYGGRDRVSLFTPGKSPEPFVVDTQDETSFPVTLVGTERVALRMGSGRAARIAIVSLGTGSIVSTLSTIPANDILSLAGASDGRRLYYTSNGFVWEAEVDGSPPRRVCPGSEVAVSSDGRRLLVQRNSTDGNHLVWVAASGNPVEEPIAIHDTLEIVMGGANLSPTAVGTDGRIAVRVIGAGSWYAPAALLDPRTGRFDVLKPGFTVDAAQPGWAPDGSVVSWGGGIQSSIWRFRPVDR